MNKFCWIQSKFLPLALNLFGKKKILLSSCKMRQLGKGARIEQKATSSTYQFIEWKNHRIMIKVGKEL